MKSFVACMFAVLTVGIMAKPEELKSKLMSFSGECESNSGVSHDEVKKLMVENFSPKASGAENIHRYCNCMLELIGFRVPDGSSNVDAIISKIPNNADKAKIVPIVQKCSVISAGSATSCKIIKCFSENKDQIISALYA